jgi:DNA-binding NarL/FixJ family response regulator
MSTISILLVDHSEIYQRGISATLHPYQDIQIIGVASDIDTAIDLFVRCAPQVVIIDITMPNCDGKTIQQMQQHHPQTHFIVLSHQRTVEQVHEAFGAGILSYLLKDVSTQELVDAIYEAALGRTVIAYEVAQALVKKPNNSSMIANTLTNRETEVMELLMKGYKNSDIAEELVITLATVKKHVRKILMKLDVESRTEAVAVAYKHKYALT